MKWWKFCCVFSCVAYSWHSMMTSSNGNIFRVTGPLCGEFTGPGEFPSQRPVTRSFDVFVDLRLNKRLSKQPWGWLFETPSWPLWRHCNVDWILSSHQVLSFWPWPSRWLSCCWHTAWCCPWLTISPVYLWIDSRESGQFTVTQTFSRGPRIWVYSHLYYVDNRSIQHLGSVHYI